MFVDLHIHTTASDGILTPTESVEKARRNQISYLSLTDHDSIEGVGEAIAAGEALGVKVIPGIELSTVLNQQDVHILGYGFDYQEPFLVKKLNSLRLKREQRMKEMVKKAAQAGISITYNEVVELAKSGSLSRAHLARLLVEKKVVNSISEAFQVYLGRGKPFFVEKEEISPGEAIDLINQIGGIPVLAHPGVTNLDSEIDYLIERGLKGIEAYYSDHTSEQTLYYLDLAKQRNLLITAGSDAHNVPGHGSQIGTFKVGAEKVRPFLSLVLEIS